MEDNFDDIAIITFKNSLPTNHCLRKSLTSKPATSMRQLMDRIDKYKLVEGIIPEDVRGKPKRPKDDAKDDLVLGTPDPRRKRRHAVKGIFSKCPQKKGRVQKNTHGGMV